MADQFTQIKKNKATIVYPNEIIVDRLYLGKYEQA